MNRTAMFATAVATFFSGITCGWSFFIGVLTWAHSGTAGQAIVAGIFAVVFLVLSGFFAGYALRARPPSKESKEQRMPYPKAGAGSTPPRPPRREDGAHLDYPT